MLRAYKFRLYPSIEQVIFLNKNFGCSRFIYNYFLNVRRNEYKEKKVCRSIYDYIKELANRKDKDSRIKLNKIQEYIQVLREYGTYASDKYIKHLDGDIWEIRPLKDRILFAAWVNGSFILLHSFVKKTNKTPPSEIEQAKRELADFKERSKDIL